MSNMMESPTAVTGPGTGAVPGAPLDAATVVVVLVLVLVVLVGAALAPEDDVVPTWPNAVVGAPAAPAARVAAAVAVP
jgi:hypothetical protein